MTIYEGSCQPCKNMGGVLSLYTKMSRGDQSSMGALGSQRSNVSSDSDQTLQMCRLI